MNFPWAAVGVIVSLLGLLGAVFRYMVWDYLHMVASLDEKYATSIAEAHAAMHERKFLPIIAAIFDSAEARKAILPAFSTAEILTEVSLDSRVREAITVISERIMLDRSYRWAQKLSIWVAISWLVVIVLVVIYSINLISHYLDGVKVIWVPSWLVPGIVCVAFACCTFALYRLALNKFIRLLRANPL